MQNSYAIHGPTGGDRFGSASVTKSRWAAGALAVLYIIGVAQSLSPIKFVGLGVPTAVGLLAGACGLFTVLVARDPGWYGSACRRQR